MYFCISGVYFWLIACWSLINLLISVGLFFKRKLWFYFILNKCVITTSAQRLVTKAVKVFFSIKWSYKKNYSHLATKSSPNWRVYYIVSLPAGVFQCLICDQNFLLSSAFSWYPNCCPLMYFKGLCDSPYEYKVLRHHFLFC